MVYGMAYSTICSMSEGKVYYTLRLDISYDADYGTVYTQIILMVWCMENVAVK